jgi:hypothetical protein
MMVLKYILAMFGLCMASSANAQNIEADFATLLERCRSSIEDATSLNTTGLLSVKIRPDHLNSRQGYYQEGWALPSSYLYIIWASATLKDGRKSHICNVNILNSLRILEPTEQAVLIRHFLIRQTELIGGKTHELDRKLSPIPPVVNLGFLLSELNPRGCRVVSFFAMTKEGDLFSAGSGERANIMCEKQ